jgi:hypothetical protein
MRQKYNKTLQNYVMLLGGGGWYEMNHNIYTPLRHNEISYLPYKNLPKWLAEDSHLGDSSNNQHLENYT